MISYFNFEKKCEEIFQTDLLKISLRLRFNNNIDITKCPPKYHNINKCILKNIDTLILLCISHISIAIPIVSCFDFSRPTKKRFFRTEKCNSRKENFRCGSFKPSRLHFRNFPPAAGPGRALYPWRTETQRLGHQHIHRNLNQHHPRVCVCGVCLWVDQVTFQF